MSDVTSKPIRVLYAYIDGAHFFTSFEVSGLCAASEDLEVAYNEVAFQLGFLLSRRHGKEIHVVPQVPLEEFRAWLEAQKEITPASIANAALANWRLSQAS
jgi:hypothetical protein